MWSYSQSASVSGIISEDVMFIYKTFPVLSSMRAIIQVDVYYPINSVRKQGNYPMMGIYTTGDHINIIQRCTHVDHGQFINRDMHPVITIAQNHSRSLRCEMDNMAVLHCTGNITVQDFIPRNFSFSFGFYCSQIGPTSSLKGLIYNISITDQTNEAKCFELSHWDICYRYLQYGVDVNLFGRQNKPTDQWWSAILTDSKYNMSCYQHRVEFLCYMFVSKCDPNSNRIIPPCREMCHDYKDGCYQGASFDCDYLPPLVGDVPCFYEPVWCKDPPIVKNALVFTNFSYRGKYLLPTVAEYSCTEGFKLHGNKLTKCFRSGQWSLTPDCSAEQRNFWLLLLLPVLLILLTVLVSIIVCTQKMKRDHIFKRHRRQRRPSHLTEIKLMDETLIPLKRTKKSPEKPRRHVDAIVIFNFDSDNNFILNKILPELGEARAFKLCIHSRDFIIGRKNNIEESIGNSNSAIIVMSQGFVDSIWCPEEFEHCCQENRNYPAFNLFVIMMQPADTLANMSECMKTFINNKTYLQKDDHELFSKMATQLGEARQPENHEVSCNSNESLGNRSSDEEQIETL